MRYNKQLPLNKIAKNKCGLYRLCVISNFRYVLKPILKNETGMIKYRNDTPKHINGYYPKSYYKRVLNIRVRRQLSNYEPRRNILKRKSYRRRKYSLQEIANK